MVILNSEDLKPFLIRDIRPHVVEQVKALVEQQGYNPARPLAVVRDNGAYIVVDGNHRLEVIREMGIPKVPCVVYPEGADPYKLAVEGNQAENTYAPMDLFDWLSIIEKLRQNGLTQEQICPKVGDKSETKHGGDRKSEEIKFRNPDLDSKPKSFLRDTSAKTGISKTVIAEEVQIVTN